MRHDDNHEPAPAPFPIDDYSAAGHYMPALADVGVRLEIVPICPDEWATGDIGYFGEPGSSGDGRFWRTMDGDVFVVMPDGRTFPAGSVRALAQWLLVRNRAPGEPTH